MAYDISVKKLARRHTLVIKGSMRADELPNFFGQAFGELFGYATRKGSMPDGPPFARYPSVGPEQVVVEAGVTVASPVAGEGRVEASDLPGGEAAVTTHIGPYESLHEAYRAVEAWMQANGRAPGGAPWETYFSDPQQEPDPMKWRTEIAWPLV